ncbi:MAG: ShlB/FhaC/HecB family hemolysin secretion/activation protein [Pseudomonadota bacterium]
MSFAAVRQNFFFTAAAAAFFGLVSADALAQTPQIQPGTAVPGTTSDVQNQIRNAGERRNDQQGLPAVTQEEDPSDASVAGSSTVTFRLNGISFPDYPPREFTDELGNFDKVAEIYEPFIGTDVTIGGLREIANRIQDLYREEGYLPTRVIIPQQTIQNGIAELRVHEGRIVHYEVNGDIGPVRKQIAALLDNLITNKAGRRLDVERYLLLSRDLPGISLTGTLRRAGDDLPGGIILVVDTARKPVDGFVQLQNRNAQATGAFTLSAGAAANSNTEYAERIGGIVLSALEVPEQFSGFGSAEMSVGNDGLVVRLETVYGLAEPGDALADLDLNVDAFSVKAEAEYPIVRSRSFSLWSRGGFEFADTRTSLGDKPDDKELFDDQLRVLYAGIQGLWLAPFGGTAEFDVELRKGIDFFGASDGPKLGRSRFDANADFTLIRGDASFAQPIWPFFEIYSKVGFQVTDKPLPTYEEMTLGELTFGRGFEPGTITGDSGFAYTGELRFQPPGIDLTWLDRLEFYGFFDYGRLYDRGQPTGEKFEELTSIGLGTRFQVLEMLYGDFYIASPQSVGLSTLGIEPDSTVKFTLTTFF